MLGVLLLSSSGNDEPYARDHCTENMGQTIDSRARSDLHYNVHTPASVVAVYLSVPPFVFLGARGVEYVSSVL